MAQIKYAVVDRDNDRHAIVYECSFREAQEAANDPRCIWRTGLRSDGGVTRVDFRPNGSALKSKEDV